MIDVAFVGQPEYEVKSSQISADANLLRLSGHILVNNAY